MTDLIHRAQIPRHLLITLVTIVLVIGFGCASLPTQLPCTDAIGCVRIAPGQPVKLGALITLTGGAAPGGIEQERAIKLALTQRNYQLLAHPLALQEEDDLCSAEGGANGALRLIDDPQLVAIFGTNCSSAAIPAAKLMSDKGLVMISAANTSPLLTSINGTASTAWEPGYFRTSWNDTEMGQVAAHFSFQKLGLTRAVVVNADDAYSKGLTDVFINNFTGFGGQVTANLTIDETETDQTSLLNAILLADPQLVFLPISRPETGSLILRQAHQNQAFARRVFVTGEGMLSDAFLKDVGEAGVGVYILGPVIPATPADGELRARFKTAFGQEPLSFYYRTTTDAVNMMLDAITAVAIQLPDGSLTIGRQALRDHLYATRQYRGVTGNLNCDRFGDCGMTSLNIVQIKNNGDTVAQVRSNIVYQYPTQ